MKLFHSDICVCCYTIFYLHNLTFSLLTWEPGMFHTRYRGDNDDDVVVETSSIADRHNLSNSECWLLLHPLHVNSHSVSRSFFFLLLLSCLFHFMFNVYSLNCANAWIQYCYKEIMIELLCQQILLCSREFASSKNEEEWGRNMNI